MICVLTRIQEGMHIGTKLYNHVIDFARKSGCYNVTLKCVGQAMTVQ